MKTFPLNRRAVSCLPFALCTLVVFFSGCTVGPNYNRPNVNVPNEYRTLEPAGASALSSQSLGDQKWAEVFQDEKLQQLIHTALQQNYDARIAAARVLEAEAQVGLARANQLPTLNVTASGTGQHNPATGPIPAYTFTFGRIVANAAWDADFWGKYRRGTEAARANLLASDWARQEVNSTLVANVAAGYFQLRELDLELDISQKALESRKESLDLTKTLEEHGINTILDVRQAEQLVYTAAADIADLRRRIGQQEDLLNILVGNNPGPIVRGKELVDEPHAPMVPAGLPSSLLERRPDIRQSEQLLVAANARIGVARAAYFPDIALTAGPGFQSSALGSLFSGSAGLWSFAGTITQPIFEGGALKSNVRLAQAQQQEALLTYQQSIQGAFRDVSDALIAYQQDQEFRAQEEQLAHAAQDAAQLSGKRYEAGTTNYLEVLTNETNALSAELGLAQARLNELLSLVQIYKALGGGWQQ
ncbi:MAG TPA: efflux transporter outer membrane subunit [Candidatus Sulfotelmatobacter sp.]|jgi:multidrug efflux system outer membrane protein|nr:efflux transporter outer membrane subunit [Candidatus Sulfotelmatobacter sp.]